MRALVTGANGLVGANLIRELLYSGYEVNALVRQSSNLASINTLNVNVCYGNVLDLDSVKAAAKNCHIIFHTAAVFTLQGSENINHKLVAVEGTKNVLMAAAYLGIQRVVLTSSSVIFGSSPVARIHDESNIIDSDEPHYVMTKRDQQDIAFKVANELGVELVSVCPTMVLGPHGYTLGPSNAIIISYLSDFTRATFPGGCNIVGARDVAIGHILAAEKGKANACYILASENLTWKAIHEMIAEMSGIAPPVWECGHAGAYMSSVVHELVNSVSKQPLLTSRSQAKMVGKYYWYSYQKAADLGYSPAPARHILANAISWLAASEHVSRKVRISMTLADEVYSARQYQQNFEATFCS